MARTWKPEEVVEIDDCWAKRDTGKAILVQLPDDDEVWIPKSQIHENSEVYGEGHTGSLVVTKWIAEQKDIVDLGRTTIPVA